MDPSTPTSRLESREPNELERDLGSLRLAVQIMLISLVILSGSLGIYLFRQVSLLRRQAESTGRLAQQMAQHFNVNLATQSVDFEKKLLAFASTNFDFQMRISRFFASNSPAPATPSDATPASAAGTTEPRP